MPAPGWTPSNASISPVNQFTWGNADIWATKWKALGYTVNNVPAPGAIVWWPNAIPDPQDSNPPDPVHGLPGSNTGHVGYVTDVYPDGSITVEMYNMRVNGEYSVVHMAYNQGYTDNSFGLGNYSVPWPGGFIHIADGPAPGTASPAEPSPGVVQATYPSQVKVIGPGSSASQFSLGNVWYPNAGFGEIGQEQRTHTNGAAALSTATWTPSGLAASTCYEIDAFVPNEYSDNPVAVYTVSDTKGTSMAAVNENQTTNDWAELGVYETNGSGGITVKLDDRGTTGLWVAADAMRFWKQPSCSGYVDASPITGPSSHSTGWTSNSGHGFFGNQLYSVTHGTTVTDTASYTPHLIPLSCYEVFAYVPDNHSDNNAATYWVLDQWYGAFWPQVNENSFTNQFTDLGMFMSRTDGSLPVTLQDLGAGQFVSADALAYTLDTNCKGIGESGTGIGHVYQANQIGPGSPPAISPPPTSGTPSSATAMPTTSYGPTTTAPPPIPPRPGRSTATPAPATPCRRSSRTTSPTTRKPTTRSAAPWKASASPSTRPPRPAGATSARSPRAATVSSPSPSTTSGRRTRSATPLPMPCSSRRAAPGC